MPLHRRQGMDGRWVRGPEAALRKNNPCLPGDNRWKRLDTAPGRLILSTTIAKG